MTLLSDQPKDRDTQKVLSILSTVMQLLNAATQPVKVSDKVEISVPPNVSDQVTIAVLDKVEPQAAKPKKVEASSNVAFWVHCHSKIIIPNGYKLHGSGLSDFWEAINRGHYSAANAMRVHSRMSKLELLRALSRTKGAILPSKDIMSSLGFKHEDVRDCNSYGLFASVVDNANVSLCRQLLEWGLTANDVRMHDNDALSSAIRSDQFEMVQVLLSFGLQAHDIRTANRRNDCLVHVAARGHLEMMRILVSVGLTVDDLRYNHCAILKDCCERGHVDMLQFLLNPDLPGCTGLTTDDIRRSGCFELAAANGHLGVCKLLFDTAKFTFLEIREDKNAALRKALGGGHLETARWLIKVSKLA